MFDKRNVGFALCKMMGFGKMLFVDDDIVISDRALRSVGTMLTGHKIAGLCCGGFPDKAVVDHAENAIIRHHRSMSGSKDVLAGHVSGNSVAVDVQRSEIFFRRKYITKIYSLLDTPQRRENFTLLTSVLPEFEPGLKEKIRNSLLAGLATSSAITATMLADYYPAWRADQEKWRTYLSCLPNTIAMKDAADCLQLASYTSS